MGSVVLRPPFRDRADAGDALALSLSMFATEPNLVVLGVGRGGVPVARQVAGELGAPFDVLVSRKVGVPGIEEVSLGAIAEGSGRVIPDDVAWYIGVPSRVVERLAARERVELERCAQLYRGGKPLHDLKGRTVILVDDGLATGATLRAAARVVRSKQPRRLIAAVPIASQSGAKELQAEVDELVALVTPEEFKSVSASYTSYAPVTDDEVLALLGRPARRAPSVLVRDVSDRIAPPSRQGRGPSGSERTLEIQAAGSTIMADLGVPRDIFGENTRRIRGLAILAQGAGCSRNSYRNRYMAGRLRESGYATLRVDLLTREEQCDDPASVGPRFAVERIAARLNSVCDWAAHEGVDGVDHTILISAGTGAAAAFLAAARRRERIFAVVSRGGRVDLAGETLAQVQAPALLIVGTANAETVQRNREAMRLLPTSAELVRIPRAGDSFAEPGALGSVAEHTVKWLDRLDRK